MPSRCFLETFLVDHGIDYLPFIQMADSDLHDVRSLANALKVDVVFSFFNALLR